MVDDDAKARIELHSERTRTIIRADLHFYFEHELHFPDLVWRNFSVISYLTRRSRHCAKPLVSLHSFVSTQPHLTPAIISMGDRYNLLY